MVFSSLKFIFGFLPIFLIFYYSVAPKYKNGVLFLGSLCFYAVGEPVYVFLIIASVLVNYFGGILIDKCKKGGRKFWLVFFLIYNFSNLFLFKNNQLTENIIQYNNLNIREYFHYYCRPCQNIHTNIHNDDIQNSGRNTTANKCRNFSFKNVPCP